MSARCACPPARSSVRDLSSRPGLAFLYRASLNKWWFDELYHLLFIVIGGRIAAAMWWFDREVVDGTVNDVGRATVGAGRGLAPRADRPGPELRPRHRAGPDRDGRLVPHPRGQPAMNLDGFPILTLITFLPLVGAVAVAILPVEPHPDRGAGLRAGDLGRLAAAAHRAACRGRPVRSGSSRRTTGSRSSASSTSSAWTGCRPRWSC